MRGSHYLDLDALVHSIPIALGGLFWIITYIVIIRACFKDKTYGVPFFCICLNIGWEFMFTMECAVTPNALGLCPLEPGTMSTIGKGVDTFWLGLDILILYQLLKWGRKSETVPAIRQHFLKYVVATLAFSLAVHYGFTLYYNDIFGIEDGWIINAVQSILFLLLLFRRPNLEGMPYAATWTKLIANLLYAGGLTLVYRADVVEHHLSPDTFLFMYVLFVTCFVCDAALVYFAHARRKLLAREGPLSAAAPA